MFHAVDSKYSRNIGNGAKAVVTALGGKRTSDTAFLAATFAAENNCCLGRYVVSDTVSWHRARQRFVRWLRKSSAIGSQDV